MIGVPWLVVLVILAVAIGLGVKVLSLREENRKLRDIVRRLEGVELTKKNGNGDEELGHGDAEGYS